MCTCDLQAGVITLPELQTQRLMLRRGKGPGKVGLGAGCLAPEHSVAKHLPHAGDSQPAEPPAVRQSRCPCLMRAFMSERHCENRLIAETVVPLRCHRGACTTGYPAPPMTTTPITG